MERTQCRGRCDLTAGSGLRLSQAGSARLAGRGPRERLRPRAAWGHLPGATGGGSGSIGPHPAAELGLVRARLRATPS